MLTREEVFIIIDRERAYQDLNYNPKQTQPYPGSPTREQRDLNPAAGILLLDSYVRKAQEAWEKNHSLLSLQQIAKIAAIAVRVLERAGGSEELLKGLR